MTGFGEGGPFEVEFVGGPADGHRCEVEELIGRLHFTEVKPPAIHRPIGDRLAAGERVPVSEVVHADEILHWYSRTEPARLSRGARVYTYAGPQ